MTYLGDDEKDRVKGVLRSTCRGGEEEEGIVRVRGRRSAWVPDGVGRHVRAHSCGLRACESYGRAVVEEVRGATEGERIVSGLFPEEFEEVDRLAMGEDVQQAQKLSVDATGGGHDGWEESQKSVGCRVCLTVPLESALLTSAALLRVLEIKNISLEEIIFHMRGHRGSRWERQA